MKSGSVDAFPGRGGLPRHSAGTQDPTHRLPADRHHRASVDQMRPQLGQRPGGERGDAPIGGGRPGDQADPFPDLLTDRLRASPSPFWVQRVEPPLVERVDHITHVIGADLQQRGDVPHGLALPGHQDHDRPPHLDRVLRGPGHPLQPAAFLHRQSPDEHLGSTSHNHLPHSNCGTSVTHHHQDQLPGQPTETSH